MNGPLYAAGVLRERHDHRRPHPPLLAAELARCDQRRRSASTRAGVRLDDVTATMGGGRVQFGGRVGFDGYLPGELNVTARGEGMQLRVPGGRALGRRRRPVRARQLQGADARRHRDGQERHLEPAHRSDGGALRLRRGGRQRRPASRPRRRCRSGSTSSCIVPSTLRIENNLARLVASADLQLRGTYDRPLLFGRAEVDRGEVTVRRTALSRDARRASTSPTRRGSSRSSTSRPRRACACRARPTA